MAKLVLCLLGGAVACIAAAAALASPQFASTFAGTYTAQTPKSSSGLDALATWADPAEPGGKPREVQKIRVAFAPGTKLDTRALPYCRASSEDIANLAVRACPAKTKLGEVRGQGVYAGSTAPFNTFATLFNARRQIIVVVTLENAKGRLLTDFRDDVERSAITINLRVGKGISLVRFQAHVPPHPSKRGKNRVTYFTTPPSCPPAGAWTTTVTFSYRDASSDQHSAATPCRQK
jgi:hypothetical protein